MPELILTQRSDSWVEARKGRITASIAAACLGLDPYQSRQKAWRAINGETYAGNKHTSWGTEFEAQARSDYEAFSGNLVTETGFWVSPEHDWLGASPDGLIGTDGLVEVKCPGNLPEKIPIHHRIQMLVQLLVTGRKWCDYFCWTHADSFCSRVHLAGGWGLIQKLQQFREQFVLTNTEPPRKKRRK